MSQPVDVPIRDESIRLGQFLKLANLVESGAEAPMSLSRSTSFGSSSAEDRARLMISICRFGVPAGAKSAFQPVTWKVGRPACSAVGTPGTAPSGIACATTRARAAPAWTWGTTVGAESHMASM